MSNHRNGWSYIGEGIAYLLYGLGAAAMCVGIGSCSYLVGHDGSDKPLIVIEHHGQP